MFTYQMVLRLIYHNLLLLRWAKVFHYRLCVKSEKTNPFEYFASIDI